MIDIAYVTIGYLIEDSISQKNREIGSQSQYTHMYIKLVTDTQTSMPERVTLRRKVAFKDLMIHSSS